MLNILASLAINQQAYLVDLDNFLRQHNNPQIINTASDKLSIGEWYCDSTMSEPWQLAYYGTLISKTRYDRLSQQSKTDYINYLIGVGHYADVDLCPDRFKDKTRVFIPRGD